MAPNRVEYGFDLSENGITVTPAPHPLATNYEDYKTGDSEPNFFFWLSPSNTWLPDSKVVAQLLRKTYDRLGENHLFLSRNTEFGGTLISGMEPWSYNGIFMAGILVAMAFSYFKPEVIFSQHKEALTENNFKIN